MSNMEKEGAGVEIESPLIEASSPEEASSSDGESLPNESEDDVGKEVYFSVSLRKMIVLNVFSFGGYVCYWFYKNWKFEKQRSEAKIQPFWRGILPFLFVHDLFSRMSAQGKKQEIEHQWNSNNIATIFTLFFLAEAYLISQVLYIEGFAPIMLLRWFLLFLLVLPLIPMQRLCNHINQDPKGEQNSNFTWLNVVWILFGGVVWILNGLGIWVSSLRT